MQNNEQNANQTKKKTNNQSINQLQTIKTKTTMKKSLIIFAALVMIASFSTKLMAQAIAPANANAEIKTALTLNSTIPLEFGKMAVTGTAGTVILTPAGSPTASNVQLLAGQTRTAASYDATGEANSAYTYKVPMQPSILLRQVLTPT